MLRTITAFFLIALATSLEPAVAANTGAPFVASITGRCTLMAVEPGTIVPNATSDVMSSTFAGGVAGGIEILATSNAYEFSLSNPAAFSIAPVGGNTNLSFSSVYSLSRATSASNVPGTVATPLRRGRSEATIDLDAVKTSGVFTGGAYQAEVLVRCE